MIYARLRLFIFSSCSLCFPPLFDLPRRFTSQADNFLVLFHIFSRRWGKASRGREVLKLASIHQQTGLQSFCYNVKAV